MLVGSTCRGSMATLDMDCVHKYVHHIADVSPPKPEYMQHFLRRGHAFAEMEAEVARKAANSQPDVRVGRELYLLLVGVGYRLL